MKTATHKYIVFILGILLVGVLAACSEDDNESDTSGSSDTSIDMMHFFIEDQEEPAPLAQLERLDDFKNDNSDVKINEEILSHDDYETKIKTLAAGDQLPDLFLIQGSLVESLVNNEQIVTMDSFFEEHEDLTDKFGEGMVKPYQYENSTYAINLPSGGSTHLIYYNKDLFAQAGIDEFPKTWDDFMQTIDSLREEEITPIALGNKEKWLMNSSYLSTLASRFTGSEWFEDIVNHEEGVKFTDEEFVDALKAINNLAEHNAFNEDMNSKDTSEQQSMYMNEEAAMFIEGAWAIGALNDNAPEDVLDNTNIDVFPPVEGADVEQNTLSGGGGWAYAINANVSDEKFKKIKELIYNLTNEEAAKLTLSKGAMPLISVDEEGIEVDRLTEETMKLLGDYNHVPIYDNALEPSLNEIINSNLQNMLIGVETPKEVAEKIQTEYEKGK